MPEKSADGLNGAVIPRFLKASTREMDAVVNSNLGMRTVTSPTESRPLTSSLTISLRCFVQNYYKYQNPEV